MIDLSDKEKFIANQIELARLFVDDFLSLDSDSVINKWKRFGGTHKFPNNEFIYDEVIKRDISHFLSSEANFRQKVEEGFDGVLLMRDTYDGKNGYSLICIEKKDFIKGLFFEDEQSAKMVYMGDCVLSALEWDYSPK